MTVKILDAQLRNAYFHKILGNMVNKYIGTEGTTKLPEVLIGGFNVSFEDVEVKTHSTLMDPQAKAVFTSLVDIVNAGVESYIEKHGYNVEIPEGVSEKEAYNIAVEEIEDEFEGKNDSNELTGIKPDNETDPVGGSVASIMKAMIDDLADRTSQDTKRVAETIIQMERERQNQLKSEDSEGEDDSIIDSEDLGDGEIDDIDNLDAEDPNKSDKDNPLEDESIEDEVKEDSKKDKKDEKEDKENTEETEGKDKKEKDDDNPFSSLESVLDNGPALESVEIGTEDVSRLLYLIAKKYFIRATVGLIVGAGVRYISNKAIKAFKTDKITGDEVNRIASDLEELALNFRDRLKFLVEEGGVAKVYADHYGWDFSDTPTFKKEKVDSKRFLAKVTVMNIKNPTKTAPEGIDKDELKAHEAKIQEIYKSITDKGYTFFVNDNSSGFSIGYPKYIIETTPATKAFEEGTEGFKEIWQRVKKGMATVRNIVLPPIVISKSQLEELKRVSKEKESEIRDKILALAKEAAIEGLEVTKGEGTWEVRNQYLYNPLVVLKTPTNGADYNRDTLKDLLNRIDQLCGELEKDLNTLDGVSKVKFYCGLVDLNEETISEFYYGISSTRRVTVEEDATESYFIVDKVNGKPVYGTESTGNNIPENYKLYNLGLFMRGLREKSYFDMKEGFESSPMNGYVHTTYVTESEDPIVLDGVLGFRAVEIDKNKLDTSENFVVETAKLALKSARKFAIESVNKAELDPTNIGFKILKDNGIYTGYVTYKCNGIESVDKLCDDYALESFEADLSKKKFIESIENYGIESMDPYEKMLKDMKVGYAKLKVAGYNAYACENFIYEAYRSQSTNEVGTEGVGDFLRKVDSKVFKGWFTRAFAKAKNQPYYYRDKEKSVVDLTVEEYKQASKDIESLWRTVEEKFGKYIIARLSHTPIWNFYEAGIFKLLKNSPKEYNWKFNPNEDVTKIVNIIGFLDFDDLKITDEPDGTYALRSKSSHNSITNITDLDELIEFIDLLAFQVAVVLRNIIKEESKKYRSLDKLALSTEVVGYMQLDTANADESKISKTSENTQVIAIVSRKVRLPKEVTASESVRFISYEKPEDNFDTAMESLELRHMSNTKMKTLRNRNNKLPYGRLKTIYDSVGQEVLNIKYSKKTACESANVSYNPNLGLVFAFEKLEPKEAIDKMLARSKNFTGIESLILKYDNGVSKVILPIDLKSDACEGFTNVARALRNYKEGLEMAKLSNISDVAIESIDGLKVKPFKGIKNGQILKAALAYTSHMMEDSLREKFNRYGVESEEFKTAQAKYKDTTKKLALAIATTTTVLSRLGLECDLSMIKDPELYMHIKK